MKKLILAIIVVGLLASSLTVLILVARIKMVVIWIEKRVLNIVIRD